MTKGAMKRVSVRQSLIAIALLGAITCFASIFALSRLVATTTATRVERTRELIVQQLELLATEDDAAAARGEAPSHTLPTYLAMRGGVLAPGASVDVIGGAVDAPTRELLADAISTATREHAAVAQVNAEHATIVVGAKKTARGATAWMAYPVGHPQWLVAWRIIGVTLGIAGFALVLASLHLAVSVHRGATALKASLASLERDLSAPVPSPGLREL